MSARKSSHDHIQNSFQFKGRNYSKTICKEGLKQCLKKTALSKLPRRVLFGSLTNISTQFKEIVCTCVRAAPSATEMCCYSGSHSVISRTMKICYWKLMEKSNFEISILKTSESEGRQQQLEDILLYQTLVVFIGRSVTEPWQPPEVKPSW